MKLKLLYSDLKSDIEIIEQELEKRWTHLHI